MTAQYVYGVTYADTAVPQPMGIDGAPIKKTAHGSCAALVSDLAAERPLGTRDDLIAHERVLESLAQAATPVLPFRFGAAMTGPEEVASDLLAANEEAFLHDLGRVADRVELVVKGRYEADALYREVLAEEPDAVALRERIRGLSEDAGREDRIRLGEVVSAAVTRKQAADGGRLVRVVSEYVEAIADRPPAREDEAANTAFLVPTASRMAFERAVDELGREWAGRVRLRVIGPLPPYDFVGALRAGET